MDSSINGTYVLKNKPLPKEVESIAKRLLDEGEKVLFVIVRFS